MIFLKKAVLALLSLFLLVPITLASLLDPNEIGFSGQSRSNNYDELINSLYANNKTTTVIGNQLWVPWFKTSSSCLVTDLQSGTNCNSGQSIDFAHNCMVSDEFSQVGLMVAMGKDQPRMDQFYNTATTIKSSFGNIPAWRIYRDNDTIYSCKTGINGNCDTASDATTRIIIALFTASNNSYFTNQNQKKAYHDLAVKLSNDFLNYEVEQTCRPSNLGYGQICYWLASGSQARNGGISSSNFAYTGYFGDAIIAMLQACAQTNNNTYCSAAGNITLNYMQAAKFDGLQFKTPPGTAFRWVNSTMMPAAECTKTCNPIMWDGYDAPRALNMCQANYYSQQINYTLPMLQQYCTLWGNLYMNDAAKAPLQYYPDGTISASYQSGYFAQGLQSMFESGGHNPSLLYKPTLDNALKHYSSTTKTFDYTSCFGVYTQAFVVRSLGMGIGRDALSFPLISGLSSFINTTMDTNYTNLTTTTNYTNANISKLLNGSLYITTNPVLADVYLNDTFKGTTDSLGRLLIQNLESNTYGIKISKTGYVTYAQNIDVDGNTQLISVVLDLAPQATGNLIVITNPAFSNVYLNGTFKGTTDSTGLLFIPDLGFGDYNLQVSKAYYATNNTRVSINSAGNTTIFVMLIQNETRVNTLFYSCTSKGKNCFVKSDTTSGWCRTVQSATSDGDVTIQGCERANNLVEVYVRSSPKKGNFIACLGQGCVDKGTSYASFYVSAG